MKYIDLVGYLAGILTTVSFFPQFLKAYKTKSTKDVSLLMLIIFILGIALWLVYGLKQKALPIVFTNSATLLIVIGITYLKIKYR
jgi:MtN3 and saliva related transmembrane protein